MGLNRACRRVSETIYHPFQSNNSDVSFGLSVSQLCVQEWTTNSETKRTMCPSHITAKWRIVWKLNQYSRTKNLNSSWMLRVYQKMLIIVVIFRTINCLTCLITFVGVVDAWKNHPEQQLLCLDPILRWVFWFIHSFVDSQKIILLTELRIFNNLDIFLFHRLSPSLDKLRWWRVHESVKQCQS